MVAWIYVLDNFKPIDVDVEEILRLAEDSPIELFDKYIKDIVEDELENIEEVKLYNTYFDPKRFEILIEYIVKCRLGVISVKLIYSDKPTVMLQKYYEYERRK